MEDGRTRRIAAPARLDGWQQKAVPAGHPSSSSAGEDRVSDLYRL